MQCAMHNAMLVPSRTFDAVGGAQTSAADLPERASRRAVQRSDTAQRAAARPRRPRCDDGKTTCLVWCALSLPMHDAARVAAELNERFRVGHPSSDLADAGLLIHQFDGYDNDDHFMPPWRPCASCPQGHCRNCVETSDRLSAALVYRNMTADPLTRLDIRPHARGAIPLYSRGTAGLILSPTANRLLCAYPYDGGSGGKVCSPLGVSAHCVPGCKTRSEDWCSDTSRDLGAECAWAPKHFKEVLLLRGDGQPPRNRL